jgi:hypothetical protein
VESPFTRDPEKVEETIYMFKTASKAKSKPSLFMRLKLAFTVLYVLLFSFHQPFRPGLNNAFLLRLKRVFMYLFKKLTTLRRCLRRCLDNACFIDSTALFMCCFKRLAFYFCFKQNLESALEADETSIV